MAVRQEKMPTEIHHRLVPGPIHTAVTVIICVAAALFPTMRGAVHVWARTLIQELACMGIVLLLLYFCLKGRWPPLRSNLTLPLSVMTILAACTSLVSRYPACSIDAMMQLAGYIAIYYLTLWSISSRTHEKAIVAVIVGTALTLSLIGFLKRFEVNPFFWWTYDDLDYPVEFMASTFGNHNHFAGFLEMAFPLSIGLFLSQNRKSYRYLFTGGIALVLLLAIIMTLSRGGWISASIALVFMAAVLKRRSEFRRIRSTGFFLAGLLGLGFYILSDTSVTERLLTLEHHDLSAGILTRYHVWAATADIIRDHPMTGTGPGTFALVFTRYHPPGIERLFTYAHNDYLHYGSEMGILFFPLVIWITIAFFRSGFSRMKSRSRQVRFFSLGAMAGILSILCHSFIDFNLHIPANSVLFCILSAIATPCPKRPSPNVSR